MRSPYANTFDVSEGFDNLFIAHAGQESKINLATDCVLRQVAYIAELLPRESSPPHLAHTQVLDGLRREWSACSFFQTAIDGSRGFGAQLLKDDGARQHFKAGIAVGHLAGDYPGDNRAKNYVRFLKMIKGFFHG